MDATPFHGIALRSSGIGAVSDLAGRRVNMGPAGGTPGTDWRRFLNRLGIQATISNAGAADAASPRKDGLNDAFLFAAGLPVGAFSQLAAEAEVETFGCIEAEPAAILAAPPEVAPFTIPAGTDSVQPEAQQPVAMGNDWVARADMPESLAQEIVKLVLENNDRMVRIHAAARATVIETAAPNNSFLPFHPGAVRCLTERGIEVPEPLRRAEPAGPGGRAGPPARDRTGTSGRP
jgi:TRAP transporter TAXI family solute receptor